jgi:hypothetical protein
VRTLNTLRAVALLALVGLTACNSILGNEERHVEAAAGSGGTAGDTAAEAGGTAGLSQGGDNATAGVAGAPAAGTTGVAGTSGVAGTGGTTGTDPCVLDVSNLDACSLQ